MKRIFVILTALTIILSLSCTFLIAEEADEDRPRPERLRRDADRDRRAGREERTRERPERILERLFGELERQREEIHALREEMAALREMLGERHGPMMFQRGGMDYPWRGGQEPRCCPQVKPPRCCEPERRDAGHAPQIEGQIREIEAGVERRRGRIVPAGS